MRHHPPDDIAGWWWALPLAALAATIAAGITGGTLHTN